MQLVALIDDILRWTETDLLPWQRDATRRLFQQPEGLSGDDYGELYSLLKASHGLPNTRNLTPIPLEAAHLPADLPAETPVVLKKLRDLKHVNRIASGQVLDFAPKGMTVIYGGNGTGKSGYARVMKHACRARDRAEKVHPDANDPSPQIRIPEATFDIEIGGTPKSLKWTSNSVPPDELSRIAVFDCHCARAYVTAEQDVAYLPYGLDVVENLANKVLPELARRLEDEMSCINVDRQPFDHLLGETEVGRLISVLNEKTDPARIKALGTLSEFETKRIDELDRALAEPHPRGKVNECRLSAGRLKALVRRLESAMGWVTDDAIRTLRALDDGAVAATRAEKVAAEELRSGENLLPGTGEPTWRALFEAARKFSTEVAYPGIEFPHTGDGSVCPLCQEPLGNAGERLRRFEKFIRDDVAEVAKQQRQELQAATSEIKGASVTIGIDEPLAEELALLDDTVKPMALAFQATLESRLNWMLDALNSHVWDDAPILGESPRQRLRNLAASQLRSARTFEKAADPESVKALKAKRDELRARLNLSACVEAILALIDRLSLRHALESCKQDLKTRPITEKSKVFASNAVTPALKDALETEFKALGIGHIKLKLKPRPDKGKIWYRLLLDLPSAHKLEEILSEGEQRAIALSSFLAELSLSNHSGGIVFDDPVSSLDHKRRGKLAKRIASESLRRQVLVFTHDVVFLHQLRSECEKHRTLPLFWFLEASGGYYGNVEEGLPWAHKSFGERIDRLEKTQKSFEKMPWPNDPSEELANNMIRQYSFLRATIERVVQDLILNATVQRFRDYIDVKRLEKVVGLEKGEVEEIARLNQRCNDVVEAHDPSSAKSEPPPTADELKQDIADLKDLIQKIKDRRT